MTEEPRKRIEDMTPEERRAFVRDAWERARKAPRDPGLERWLKAATTIRQEDLDRRVN